MTQVDQKCIGCQAVVVPTSFPTSEMVSFGESPLTDTRCDLRGFCLLWDRVCPSSLAIAWDSQSPQAWSPLRYWGTPWHSSICFCRSIQNWQATYLDSIVLQHELPTHITWVFQRRLSVLLKNALFKAMALMKLSLWEEWCQIPFLKITKFLIFQNRCVKFPGIFYRYS